MTTTAVDINNRYTLQRKLGAGGMGEVWTVTDRLHNDTVALKRVLVKTQNLQFKSRADNDTNLKTALAQEFQTLATLRHPNVINVLDYGFDADDQPYFTMRLLKSARTIVAAGLGLSLEDKVRLLIQMLQALAYLHRRGILHRDIKPANVLVEDRQRVLLVDFGLAIEAERAMSITGTVAYMAPEVMQGHGATPAADLFAVGVIAYEMFAGVHPYKGGNVTEMIQAVLTSEPDWAKLSTSLSKPIVPRDDTADATLIGIDDPVIPEDEDATTILPSQRPAQTAPQPPPTPPRHPLATVIGRLLEKDPAARYQDANAVIRDLCNAANLLVPAEVGAIRESYLQAARFVGRDAELDVLSDALDAARLGSGSAWLIGGESGVGKSRLVNEIRIAALVKGMLALRGQAVEGGGRPFEVWRGVLPGLVLHVPPTDTEQLHLSNLLPSTRHARSTMSMPVVDGDATREQINLSIRDLFSRLERPHLLILEDLHWSGLSLEVLQLLSARVKDLPLLILGTFRDDEAPHLPDELPDLQTLTLPRLQPDAIAALSTSMLGTAGHSDALVDLLHRETEGNVLFIVEVVRALAENTDNLADIAQMSLPQQVMAGGVADVLRRRLQRVPAWGQAALQLAAVAGRRLDLTLLADLAPVYLREHDLDAWLTACADAAVLAVEGESWQFSHDKLRETLRRDIDPATAPTLHQQVAEGIEKHYPDDDARADILADHWQVAGNAEREIHYRIIAAREQLTFSAQYERAGTNLQRALTLINTSATQPHPLHTETLLLLAQVALNQSEYDAAINGYQAALASAKQDQNRGQQGTALLSIAAALQAQANYEDARHHAEQALSHFEAVNDQAQTAAAVGTLAAITGSLGDVQAAIPMVQQAIDIARSLGASSMEATQLGRMADMLESQGDLQEAVDFNQQALDISRGIGDRAGVARYLGQIGGVLYYLSRYDESYTYNEESLNISLDIGDRQSASIRLGSMGSIRNAQGRAQEGRETLDWALQLARDIGDPVLEARHIGNIASSHAIVGEFDAAIEKYQQAADLSAQTGNKRAAATYLGNLGAAYYYVGNYEESADSMERALQMAVEMGDKVAQGVWRGNLAGVYADMGDLDKALTSVQAGIALAQETGERSTEGYHLGFSSTIHRRMGKLAASLEFSTQAIEAARDIGDDRQLCGHWVSRGVTSWMLGDNDTAHSAFDEAITLANTIGNRRDAADGMIQVAALEWTEGKRANALETVTQARDIVQELGDLRTLVEAQAMLATAAASEEQLDTAADAIRARIEAAQAVKLEGAMLSMLVAGVTVAAAKNDALAPVLAASLLQHNTLTYDQRHMLGLISQHFAIESIDVAPLNLEAMREQVSALVGDDDGD